MTVADFHAEVLPFTIDDSTVGEQEIRFTGGGDFADVTADQIKGGIVLCARSTSNDGTAAAQACISIGTFATDGTNVDEWSAAIRDENGVGQTDCKNAQRPDYTLMMIDPSSDDFEVLAYFVDTLDGTGGPGISLYFEEVDAGSTFHGYVLLFAGDDIECAAGTDVQVAASATYTPGFEADFWCFAGTRGGGSGAWDTPTTVSDSVLDNANISCGFAGRNMDGNISNIGMNWMSDHDEPSEEIGMIADNETFMYHFHRTFGAFSSHYVSGTTSTQFTVSRRDGTGDNSFGWFALSAPGWFFETEDVDFSSTDDVMSTYGSFNISPDKFAIILPTENTNFSGSINSGSNSNCFGVGVATGHGGRAAYCGITVESGSDPSNTDSYVDHNRWVSTSSPHTADSRQYWFDRFVNPYEPGQSKGSVQLFQEASDQIRKMGLIVCGRADAEEVVPHMEAVEPIDNPISFTDHFEGDSINPDWWDTFTGNGGAVSVTDSYADIDWAGAASEQAMLTSRFALDTSRSFSISVMARCVDADAFPMISICDDGILSGGRDSDWNQALRTGAVFDGTGIQFVKDEVGNTTQNWDYWHGEEEGTTANSWESTSGHAIADAAAGSSESFHLIAFEFDAENQRFRWHGMHRHGRTAIKDLDQGARWVAQTDWVDLADFDTSAHWDNVHLVLGGGNQNTGQGQMHVEFVIYESLAPTDQLYIWTNAKESDSDNYLIHSSHGYGTQFFEKGRGESEIAIGGTGDWNEFGYRKKKVVQDANGLFWMFVEGWDTATTDTAVGLFTASDPEGPWTEATASPIISPSDIATDVNQITAPWPFIYNGEWYCWVGAQYTDASSTHRAFLFKSDGEPDGTWTLQSGSGTDGCVFDASGFFDWRHDGVNDVVMFPIDDSGTFRALVSGFVNGRGWQMGYAEGTTLTGMEIDEYASPLVRQRDTAQQFSAVSGRTITVADSSVFDRDALVVFRNANSTDDWATSRVRKIVSSTQIELYHEIGGLSTADSNRLVAQTNNGSVTPNSVRALPGGGWRVYCTIFQPWVLESGAIGNMETNFSIVLPEDPRDAVGVIDWTHSPHVYLHIWNADRNNENINFFETSVSAFTASFTENVQVTESMSEDFAQVFSTNVQATQSMVEDLSQVFGASVNVGESETTDLAQVMAATVEVTESHVTLLGRTLTENVQVSESAIFDLAQVFSESVEVSESSSWDYSQFLVEMVEVTESLVGQLNPGGGGPVDYVDTFTENVQVSESTAAALAQTFVENLEVTESRAVSLAQVFIQNVAAGENTGRSRMDVIEAVAVTELFVDVFNAGTFTPSQLLGYPASLSLSGSPSSIGLVGKTP